MEDVAAMDNQNLLVRHQHFLERAAERTGGAELDFALQLYEDPALVTGVLAEATLPLGDCRIALGLDPAGDGPWLVVTRTGEFVTVLGKGMNPTGLHPLHATQVASLVARVLKQRQRENAANAVVPPDRRSAFLSRMFRKGADVTREDFLLFVAWLPVMYHEYRGVMMSWLGFALEVLEMGQVALQIPPKRFDIHLKRMHEAFWACTAMLPVLAYEGRRHDWLGKDDPLLLPRVLCRDGFIEANLRTAWALGRIGKPILPILKQGFREAEGADGYLPCLYGMLVMASRYTSLRAEIRKLVTAKQPQTSWSPGIARFHASLAPLLVVAFDEPDAIQELHLVAAREHTRRLCQLVGGELATRYADAEAIPPELAKCVATTMTGDCRESAIQPFMVAACFWLGEVEGEALFAPAEFMQHWCVPWRRDHSTMMIRQYLGDRLLKPVRAPERQGRNERCNCGSGRKYKVCCAVHESQVETT
jgi:hypothetical protein